MSYDFAAKETLARQERDTGNYTHALALFHEILSMDPDYEHGLCYFEIAGIYEDQNNFKLAEDNYRKALQQEPDNTVYLGGLASLFYLHGNPQDALEVYLELFRLEAEQQRETMLPAIHRLGERLGISPDNMEQLLQRKR